MLTWSASSMERSSRGRASSTTCVTTSTASSTCSSSIGLQIDAQASKTKMWKGLLLGPANTLEPLAGAAC